MASKGAAVLLITALWWFSAGLRPVSILRTFDVWGFAPNQFLISTGWHSAKQKEFFRTEEISFWL
eukprot:2028200-Heterocapsa_arctica.AAC.1